MKAQGRAGPAQPRAGGPARVGPEAPAAATLQRGEALDWRDLRFFLELARSGSLARAATRLGVDRNTVARRVTALEAALGLTLFERGPQGWERTGEGEVLAGLATRVEEDVLALARRADARDDAVRGAVRLTTASHLAAFLLAPALQSLRSRHPGLVLEIAADQRNFDLGRREADLALRMGRPSAGGLVTRKLADVAYRFYASVDYLKARRGPVDFDRDRFLGVEESLPGPPHERWLQRVAPGRQVVFRCNATAALLSATRAGLGVALLPCFAAEGDPGLRRLEGPEPDGHQLWLLVHGDLRRAPRVRAVLEWVDEVIEAARPGLAGTALSGS
jgi:DNA-binding transcriptional LysR family regulator